MRNHDLPQVLVVPAAAVDVPDLERVPKDPIDLPHGVTQEELDEGVNQDGAYRPSSQGENLAAIESEDADVGSDSEFFANPKARAWRLPPRMRTPASLQRVIRASGRRERMTSARRTWRTPSPISKSTRSCRCARR